MKHKSGFTLAEVLLTLIIIGLVAAMTIPDLARDTQSQEYKTALKKAVSTLNQALNMQYALEGTTLADFKTNATTALTQVFMQRLNVMSTAATSNIAGGNRYNVFYTADGIKFGFNSNTAYSTCTSDDSGRCWLMYIDVNGDKGPNTRTGDASSPKDVYLVTLYATRAIPYGSSSWATQEVMYGG